MAALNIGGMAADPTFAMPFLTSLFEMVPREARRGDVHMHLNQSRASRNTLVKLGDGRCRPCCASHRETVSGSGHAEDSR